MENCLNEDKFIYVHKFKAMDVASGSEVQIKELCKSCDELCISENVDASEKCKMWLNMPSNDVESVCDSEISEYSNLTETTESSGSCSLEYTIGNREILLGGAINSQQDLVFREAENTYKNITIKKSKNVHLGNVIVINGPVYVNQTANVIHNQMLINRYVNTNDSTCPKIVSRIGWNAYEPPEKHANRKYPAKFVIISHTASGEATTENDNVSLVQSIQAFHIDKNWDDIGYNFLIGADCNVYEGRGWHAIGAHTRYYNKVSIGISFIGRYSIKLPPKAALDNAKRLIEYGVKIGVIDKNYQLLGHCQCSETVSPGRMLFEEIQTWKNWNESISVENKAKEINECD